jgi:hypothetical protein
MPFPGIGPNNFVLFPAGILKIQSRVVPGIGYSTKTFPEKKDF